MIVLPDEAILEHPLPVKRDEPLPVGRGRSSLESLRPGLGRRLHLAAGLAGAVQHGEPPAPAGRRLSRALGGPPLARAPRCPPADRQGDPVLDAGHAVARPASRVAPGVGEAPWRPQRGPPARTTWSPWTACSRWRRRWRRPTYPRSTTQAARNCLPKSVGSN